MQTSLLVLWSTSRTTDNKSASGPVTRRLTSGGGCSRHIWRAAQSEEFQAEKLLSANYPIDLPLYVWMKIISKQSAIGIEKSFIWAKLRTTAQKTASQITLRNCSEETWFSAQFYILSKQRTSNKSGIHSFRVSKKKTPQISTYTASQYGLGTLAPIIKRWPALVSQEGRHLIFIFNLDILYFWSMCPFL